MVKYCGNCGKQINENANFCQDCGAVINKKVNDDDRFLWGILGFCVPLMGFILFLVWKKEKPGSAKVLGLGALISLILRIFLVILVLYPVFKSINVTNEKINDNWSNYRYDYDYNFE